MSSIVSLTKQQIAVYKDSAEADTQNKVLENVRWSCRAGERHKPRSLPQTVISPPRVDAEPPACSMNIPQSVLVAADKVTED